MVLHKLFYDMMHFPAPRSLLLMVFSELIPAFQKSENISVKLLNTGNTTLCSWVVLCVYIYIYIYTHTVSVCGAVSQHFQTTLPISAPWEHHQRLQSLMGSKRLTLPPFPLDIFCFPEYEINIFSYNKYVICSHSQHTKHPFFQFFS